MPITPGRVAAVLAFVAALGALMLAPKILGGARFGRLIERRLPPTCGRIHVGGGEWTWGAALALLRNRPAALVLTEIVVTDPAGTEVVHIRRLAGRLELSGDRLRATIRDLQITGAAWRFARTADGGVGFLRALAPTCGGDSAPASDSSRAQARAGRDDARPRGTLAIPSASIDGLDVLFDLPDWGLSLKNVRATARLAFPNPGAAASPLAFEVSGAEVRGGGFLRILDGRGALQLPFSHATLRRVATTAERPDAILLDASTTTGKSTMTLAGAFTGLFADAGPRRPPGIDLTAEVGDAGDAVQVVLAPHAPGALNVHGGSEVAHLTMRFGGPFEALRLDARATGFSFGYHSIDLRAVAFQVAAEPVAGRFRVSGLSLTGAAGGGLQMDARLDQDRVTGSLVFHHFATRSLLPPFLLPLFGGTVDGSLRARLDLTNARAMADELFITLRRPSGVSGPSTIILSGVAGSHGPARPARHPEGLPLRVSDLRFADGALELPGLRASLWGGHVTLRGRLTVWDRDRRTWLSAPRLHLSLRGDGITFEQLTGVEFMKGRTSFRADVNGTLAALDIRIGFPPTGSLQVFGQPFRLPRTLFARLAGGNLTLPALELTGAEGGRLTVSGGVATWDDADLTVDATLGWHRLRLDPFFAPNLLSALPAGATATAVTSGSAIVRLGRQRQPSLAGRLTELAVVVTHPAGTTNTRAAVANTPTTSTGGRIEVHTVGDVPFSAQARGGRLALGPARFGGDAGDFEVAVERANHTETVGIRGRVNVAALEPLFEPRFEPLFERFFVGSIDGLVGAVNVDVSVVAGAEGDFDDHDAPGERQSRAGDGAQPLVTGHAEIAAPVSFRPAGAAVGLELRSGRIDFWGRRATTKDLLARLGTGDLHIAGELALPATGPARFGVDVQGALDAHLAELIAPGILHDAAGEADIQARIAGTLAEPHIVVAAELPRPVHFTVPAFGPDRIQILGGNVSLDDTRLTVRALDVRVGSKINLRVGTAETPATLSFARPLGFDALTQLVLPLAGEVRGWSMPGLQLERARFSLSVAGDPRRRLTVAGDVVVDAARASPSALSAAKSARAGPAKRGLLDRLASRTDLDVKVRARGGALVIDVPYLPDPRLDADLHLGGTLSHPAPTGQLRPSGVYSFLTLMLYRLTR